ncbi:unnamed protein product [Arabis nemorensis]|uniref:Reverse transcriptase zinc-binding domain-containing protein n=1 Tax=Arabis nemorensis TaxID=586526 RepID=A0A565C461_9BRAS|nr:unnamed protein product [Arabis nemorensis]
MSKLYYEPLIDKIRTRMISWSSKSFSFAGRLQLIQSVIASISNFWCSVFKLPKRCLESIERMCFAFLWSGSLHSATKSKDIAASNRGSWIWKKLLKLRPLAATFIQHEIQSGKDTFFWFDDWLGIGPLIRITGDIVMERKLLGIELDSLILRIPGN